MTGPRPVTAVAKLRGPRWRRRAALVLLLGVGAPLVLVAAVAASIWSENRYPSDGADASTLARARGVVTRPVVGAVSEQV